MKKLYKKELKALITTVFFIFVFSISFWIFPPLGHLINPVGQFWDQTKGPFEYPEYEVFRDPHLHGEQVTVYRDQYGVPHIYAEDYRDLFYVYGYLQASDRFFEMTLFKVLGYGRLSEVAGSLALPIDKYMRSLSFWKSAQEIIDIAEANKEKYERVYNELEEFCLGVNKWLDNNRHNLPIEFSILGLPIENWEMKDTALMAYIAGFMLSYITEDLSMEELRLTLGPFLNQYQAKYNVNLNDLFPLWNMTYPYETPIIPDNHSIFLSSEDHGIYSMNLLNTIHAMNNIGNLLLETLSESIFGLLLEPFLNPKDWGIGSNNWVINGSVSSTGKPILCGDPHLPLLAPSIWYEAHLVCIDEEYEELVDPRDSQNKYYYKKTYNTYGVAFPGTPITLIGHNEHCAWSETNIGSDSFVDFYLETLNPDGTQYNYSGEWVNLEIIDKPILVKGIVGYYYEPFTIKYTRHGPIITDVLSTFGDIPYLGGNVPEGYEHLSVKYIGYNNSDEYNQLISLDLLNRAENVSQIYEALKYFPNPPQNFVVADDLGNIGMICAGLFPIRAKYNGTNWVSKPEYDGRYIQPGDGTGQEWIGFILPEHLPYVINPINQSYLASANQRTIAAAIYNYSIGDSWAPGWRARSINRYLNTSNMDSPYYNKKISFEDMQNIQYSDYDIAVQEFIPIIINTYYSLSSAKKAGYSNDLKTAINLFTEWNNSENYKNQMNKYLIAPTIFNKWFDKLPENLWGDEWAAAECKGMYPSDQITEYWIKNKSENDPFFDDNSTNNIIENKTDVILNTLEETLEDLRNKYGDLGDLWAWGDHHKLALIGIPLVFSVIAGVEPESYPLHGSSRVLNNAPVFEMSLDDFLPIDFDIGQYVFSGPSWRQVIDFSKIEQSIGILPGGVSGNALNPHYDDQLQLWVEGNYKVLLFHSQLNDWLESEISATQEWYNI